MGRRVWLREFVFKWRSKSDRRPRINPQTNGHVTKPQLQYQGRGAPHWHIYAWIVSFVPLSDLNGQTGKAAELAGYAVSRDTRRASRKAQRQGAFGPGRLHH